MIGDNNKIQRANSASNILNASTDNLNSSLHSLDKLLNDQVDRNHALALNHNRMPQFNGDVKRTFDSCNDLAPDEPVWQRRNSSSEQRQQQFYNKADTVLCMDSVPPPPPPSTVLSNSKNSNKKINKSGEVVKSGGDAGKSANNFSSNSNCSLDKNKMAKSAQLSDDNYLLWIAPVAAR